MLLISKLLDISIVQLLVARRIIWSRLPILFSIFTGRAVLFMVCICLLRIRNFGVVLVPNSCVALAHRLMSTRLSAVLSLLLSPSVSVMPISCVVSLVAKFVPSSWVASLVVRPLLIVVGCLAFTLLYKTTRVVAGS